jgi:uncharacterized protein YjbI with pentapeptide repeats
LATVTEAKPPLVPKRLESAPMTLEDEATWEEVLSDGSVGSPRALRDITFRRSRFADTSLVGLMVERLRCENVEFVRCDLSGAIWDSAVLERVVFRDCRMTGLTLSGAKIADVRIVDSAAELANFRMAKARRLQVESSMLRSADFQDARLAQSRIEDSDLRAASFQHAQLQDVSLRASKLDDVRGVGSLRGARVTPVQAIVLGGLLLAETGIEVVD